MRLEEAGTAGPTDSGNHRTQFSILPLGMPRVSGKGQEVGSALALGQGLLS